MIQAVSKEQTILESLQTLSPQQQQSVLDFIEFLQFKTQKQEIVEESGEVISMLEAAKEFVGCLDSGEGDLSMKKQDIKKGYKAI
ncbi:MAG: DUF2281 domain-containing protein [Hormoscilla sp. GM102CHS1]|nr:DUF2281 domain-containing protein [Hormoscilla sp. GM102CHS1]